jgi:cell division protein FtsA
MAKTRIVAGIELGSSKISTVIAQVNTDTTTFENTINIVGASSSSSKGVRKGQIIDIEDVVEATISSVEAAERMAGYNLDAAYIALGGAHVSSQNSHGVVAVSDPEGEVSPDDVERVIEAASAISLPSSRELIHVIPKEFVVDGETGVKDPVSMSGVRLEVETHLVTASQAAVKNIRKAVNDVGIHIEDLVFAGLAASEAVLTPTEKELGCVLLDIGGGTTSVAAFIDGALTYSAVIPIGARNVTNDLAIGLRVSLDTAEKIKLALSKNQDKEEGDEINLERLGVKEQKKVSRKTLVEGIIRPRLNEIFSMVRLDLDKVGIANKVPSGVILTGGGADTVGIQDSAKRILSLPIRIGKPKGVGGLIDDIVTPSFAVPVGLVLYGAQDEPQESLTRFTKGFKLPAGGLAGRFVDIVKELLP